MSEVIIIGNGPAGISASLYTQRAGVDTLIIGKDSGALQKADKVENYYGFVEPIKANQLIANGIAQAKRIGATYVCDEVIGISYNGNLVVQTKSHNYEAPCVILAMGSARKAPSISGIAEFEGKGVSYCAVCDAFFYRGKAVGVLGNAEYALHEALELASVAQSVTLLTNGDPLEVTLPENIQVNTQKVEKIIGETTVTGVSFEGGETLALSGVFVAVGVAGSSDLARKLGAQTNGNTIVVGENMQTNIPGLYAAGDCVGGLLQISKAVSDGAKAGIEAIKYIRANKK